MASSIRLASHPTLAVASPKCKPASGALGPQLTPLKPRAVATGATPSGAVQEPRSLSWQAPSVATTPRRQSTVATAAAPEPAASPFLYTDYAASPAQTLKIELAAAPSASTALATTANSGNYTWLTHPCPRNPFRTKADEDAWYVEPSMEQRRLAMALGIPLYG